MRDRRGSQDHRELRPKILELLVRWPRLCESDIDRMIRSRWVLGPTLRSMAKDRLIRLEHIGDEDVAIITEHGRIWLRNQQQAATKPSAPARLAEPEPVSQKDSSTATVAAVERELPPAAEAEPESSDAPVVANDEANQAAQDG